MKRIPSAAFTFLRQIFSPPGTKRWRTLEHELQRRGFSFARLTELLHYRPKRRDLFLEALLHRSFLPHAEGDWSSNERLEFLGDAILDFIIADHLYREFPDREEGDLTKLRSRLVNRRTLAQRGRALGLGELLLLSSSATQSVEGGSETIIADAYEAVLGAVYVDGGIEEARRFVHRTLLDGIDLGAVAANDDNYKSALLEYAQGHGVGAPRYAVVREEGPEHDRRFTIEVSIGSQPYGTGTGRSKKDAEQAAAERALERIRRQQQTSRPPRTRRSRSS